MSGLPQGKVQLSVVASYAPPPNPQKRMLRNSLRPKSESPPKEGEVPKPKMKSARRPDYAPETLTLLNAVQDKYGSPAGSNLEVVLRSGSNQFDLELNTD